MALNKETTEQLIESLQDAMFSTSIKNGGGQSIRERVQNLINQNVGGVTASETVEVSSGELVVNPNQNKLIDPITQPAGTDVEIKYGTDRVEKTTQQFLYTTAGDGSATTFSPDFKAGNKENDTIDNNSVNTYLITLLYWDEKTKFVFITKGAQRDSTAPTATFTPSDGGTLSSVSDNITIDFDEAVRATDEKELINDGSTPASHQKNVGDIVTLEDNGGNTVATTYTINSAKTQITGNPDSNLLDGETYTIKLLDHEDYSGNEVGSTQSITFTASVAANKKYQLDGVNEYLSFPSASQINFDHNDDFSIEAFVKLDPNEDGTFAYILSKYDSNDIGYFIAKGTAGNPLVFYQTNGANRNRWSSDTSYASAGWIHIVYNNNGTLFVNGSSVSTTQQESDLGTNSTLNSESLQVLAKTAGSSVYSQGEIRIDAIYNKIITASEANDLYNGGDPENADLTNIGGSDISANCVHRHICNNDTESGGIYTLIEEQNSNNGTSVNTDGDELILV